MELTNKQEQGLKTALSRFTNNEKFTVIAGFAGTGKSTLVKFIVEALSSHGINPAMDVCYATYTGKAAQVLLRKGNKNVSTLHKLLYKSIPKIDGSFMRIPNKSIPYRVVIVDEVSMVPMQIMKLLLSMQVYVICLGDPFQIPTFKEKDDNHLLDNPHVFLDEIMRQAKESGIIRLSFDIREGRTIDYQKCDDVAVYKNSELVDGMYTWSDQIICATNAKRIGINCQVRDMLGRGEEPEDGDKLICLTNYWDVCSDQDNPLVNGTIGYFENGFPTRNTIPYYLGGGFIDIIHCDFRTSDGDIYKGLDLDMQQILTGTPALDWKLKYKMCANKKTAPLVPLDFTFGYAITGHKAQGSEEKKVLGIEERFPFKGNEHARWLYTVATRAEEKFVLIRRAGV